MRVWQKEQEPVGSWDLDLGLCSIEAAFTCYHGLLVQCSPPMLVCGDFCPKHCFCLPGKPHSLGAIHPCRRVSHQAEAWVTGPQSSNARNK